MSLIGTKIADLTQPLEIIRTIHSFDPCTYVRHVMDFKGQSLNEFKVEPNFAKF